MEDLSYNLFLYQKRTEQNLKKRAFAKQLGVRPFRYRLIENGYIRPSVEEIEKISAFFGVDFYKYLEGFNGYPTELDDKKFLRIANFFYYLFTKKAFRIVCFILALLCLILTVAGFIINPQLDYSRTKLYDGRVIALREAVIEKGRKSFSMLDFSYPLVHKNIKFGDGCERAVLIKSNYNAEEMNLSFCEIVWYGDVRLYLTFLSEYEGFNIWSIIAYDYEKYETVTLEALEKNGDFTILSEQPIAQIAAQALSEFNVQDDFDFLFSEKLGSDLTFAEMVSLIGETVNRYSSAYFATWFSSAALLLASCLLWFLFGYATIYKKEKDAGFSFNRSDELLGFKPKYTAVKKDLRFTPFLPETLLRVIGILLVFLGSFRAIYYSMNAMTYSSGNIQSANELYSIQLLGLFLIFFINFDVYMDDNRLFRNLMIYPMVFLLVYALEASLVTALHESESIISYSLDKFSFPNPFGAATCYFLIMVFLFFTPRFVKSKKRLIVYRALAILPIALIIVSFLLTNVETVFGTPFDSYWVSYLFREERFSLSILAITYLVSLFFMRLHFKRKFGEEYAYRYFMGNRFILAKNALAAGLIVGIWAFEMIASKNATMSALGFGQNKYLVLLAPLVFFYHPHKNARNTKIDVLLISIYAIVLALLYFSAGVVAIASLV